MGEDRDQASRIRDHVDDWPYLQGELARTLDHELIEQHGTALVRRALQSERLVAFLGSGVSMAYGRLGWADWLHRSARAAIEDAAASDDATVRRLRHALENLCPDAAHQAEKIPDSRFPAIFQLMEQLDTALKRARRGSATVGPDFRARIQSDLSDDVGHARSLVDTWLAKWARPLPRGQQKAAAWIEAHPRNVFGVKLLRQPMPVPDAEELRKILFDSTKGNADLRLPAQRIAYTAMLLLLDPKNMAKWFAPPKKEPTSLPPLPPWPGATDPLAILTDGLHIRRFLTTNYDQEVERLLEQRGFKRPPHRRSEDRFDALGTRASAWIFKPERAADLIDFSIPDEEDGYALLHLHGSTAEPKSMVVTERDYQQVYLRQGDEGEVVRDALGITFGANTVLFLGNGMQEDDILRPLRHFLSNEPLAQARQTIALLPSLKKTAAVDVGETVSLFSRYGVYAIHYGHAEDEKKQPVMWLGRKFALIGKLQEFFRTSDPAKDADSLPSALEAKFGAVELGDALGKLCIDGVALGEHPALQPRLECQLLHAALAAAKTLQQQPNHKRAALVRQAYSILLEGLGGTFIAACLRIKLKALEIDWQKWKQKQYRLPEHRKPAYGRREFVRADGSVLRILVRHPVALRPALQSPSTPPGPPDTEAHKLRPAAPLSDDFVAEAPSRAMQTFLDALEWGVEQRALSAESANMRRVFVLLGRRGVGKGHFFECLGHRLHVEAFIQKSWPASTGAARPDYAGAAFLNLSFSHEVVSAFDGLAQFLAEQASHVFDKEHADFIQDIARSLADNRVARMRSLMQAYSTSRQQQPAHKRLIVGINGFNLLFDSTGQPKNAQLARILKAMFSSSAKTAPIDYVLVCGETNFPAMFRKSAQAASPSAAPAEEKEKREKEEEGDAFGPRAMPLCLLTRSNPPPQGLHDLQTMVQRMGLGLASTSGDSEHNAFVHVMRHARASSTIAKYFPEVIWAMYWAVEERRKRKKATLPEFDRERVQQSINEALNSSRDEQDFDPHLSAWQLIVRKDKPRDGHDIHGIDRRLRELYKALAGNRFLLTLVAAAGSELSGLVLAKKAPPEAIAAAGRWIDGVQELLTGKHEKTTAELVINEVLNQYRSRHDAHAPLPIANGQVALRTLAGWELQLSLLRTLSLVGDPVESDVLAAAPAVNAACKAIPDADSFSAFPWKWLCDRALDLLVRRCLVFRLEPIARREDNNVPQWRYAVHRLVQKHVLNKLRSPDVELAEVDYYSLSMWATQSDDLPSPHAVAARDIAALTAAWSGYPISRVADHRGEHQASVADDLGLDQTSPYHEALAAASFNAAKTPETPLAVDTLPARMLRASLGVMRTVYSASIVSRFDSLLDDDGAAVPPQGGYFEEYRTKLDWLISNARTLRWTSDAPPDRQDFSHERFPFRAEELVWLYNESGLVSMLQGRLPEAADMLGRGLQVSRAYLEPVAERGSLWARIHMNLAIVDIERGRLRDARRYLTNVVQRPDENPIAHLIARGLVALCDHVAGRASLAQSEYESVIDKLDQYGKSRAVAVFSRHLAELLRTQGQDQRVAAVTALERSYAAAKRGGHTDLVQLVRLARIRLAIADEPSSSNGFIQDELEAVRSYAAAMGMRRLTAEVAYARGLLLFKAGETRHAARHACECLRIAVQSDLKLRQVTALSLLARIYGRRRNTHAADLLAARASSLADACGYANGHKVPNPDHH